MEARGVDGNPARGAAKQKRVRAEDKFTGDSHDKESEATRYCGSDYFRGRSRKAEINFIRVEDDG